MTTELIKIVDSINETLDYLEQEKCAILPIEVILTGEVNVYDVFNTKETLSVSKTFNFTEILVGVKVDQSTVESNIKQAIKESINISTKEIIDSNIRVHLSCKLNLDNFRINDRIIIRVPGVFNLKFNEGDDI